ncbi:ras-related protein rab-10 [Stylonychia lemnae]|uniref:Ras-related protein rab-10 n=1 Tax=Stylonychia lemnae TaxID=5949 RepID=A0A078AND6_STYLE|nr:ras-related protein rab-10 [Stylonychia lemnae]|eukprot:CDW82852.1 ras-related protein rab-10 [Stylonychia lemnae]
MASQSQQQAFDLKIDIGLVGNSDVGKTCLIQKYQYQDNYQIPLKKQTTLGIETKVVKLKIQGQMVKVVLWDPAGQERFESMTKQFYQNLDGVMLVFDMTNEKSYNNLTKWLGQINEIRPCPYVITANKADLEEQRMICDEQVELIEQKFNTQCILTSAMTGQNVEEAFNTLINTIIQIKLQKLHKTGSTEQNSPTMTSASQKHKNSKIVRKGKKKESKCC